MKTRIITAIVALAIFVPVLIFSDTIVFALAMTLCAVVGGFEMLRCVGAHRNFAVSVPIIALCGFLCAYVWFAGDLQSYLSVVFPVILVFFFYTFSVMVFSRGKVTLSDVTTAVFPCLYLGLGFTCLLFLRYYDPMGQYTYLLVFVGAWITDTFAYFTGRILGKHKLIPDVSPKKTVEGSIGGIVFCVGSFLMFGLILDKWVGVSVPIRYGLLAVYGLVCSVISQIGDLLMSAIKRNYDIKDYGKLFPGHGGVLDRFDSILAVSVILFVLEEISCIFGGV